MRTCVHFKLNWNSESKPGTDRKTNFGFTVEESTSMMYDGAVTTVRSGRGKTLAFEIKVGVHHVLMIEV